jgi:hypothetical protein
MHIRARAHAHRHHKQQERTEKYTQMTSIHPPKHTHTRKQANIRAHAREHTSARTLLHSRGRARMHAPQADGAARAVSVRCGC